MKHLDVPGVSMANLEKMFEEETKKKENTDEYSKRLMNEMGRINVSFVF
jgi:hypothetical protein